VYICRENISIQIVENENDLLDFKHPNMHDQYTKSIAIRVCLSQAEIQSVPTL